MKMGLVFAIERLISTVNEFNSGEKYEIQLTNAEMVRETASVIANATEDEIVAALRETKKR